jgi:hypothetical protein
MARKTLTEMAQELERLKNSRYDVVAPSTELKAVYDVGTKTVKLTVPYITQDGSTIRDFPISTFAHSQIAEKCGIPKPYYDRMFTDGNVDLLNHNINTYIKNNDTRLVRIADFNDGKGQTVRALLSNQYRIIDSSDVFYASLNEFSYLTEKKGMHIEFPRLDLTDQHLYIKATSPDLSGEVFHFRDGRTEAVQGGVIISNSDVGVGAFKVEPFINVLVCHNGLIGDNKFIKIHLGKERGQGIIQYSSEINKLEDKILFEKIRELIRATFTPEIFNTWLDKINKVASTEVPKPTVVIDNIISKYDIPQKRRDELLNQFSKESQSIWGVAMTVNRIAQNEEDYENQIKYEKVASDILTLNPQVILKEVA